jgi:hypothetical protein
MIVKKDIIAALTFLLTGLLFYVVQTETKAGAFLSSGTECEAQGVVVVGEKAPDTPPENILQSEGTRDS